MAVTTQYPGSLPDWYHQHDYAAVEDRLAAVRKVTLGGDIEQAAENLRRAYYFAVLSIRTVKDIHEHAFELWMDGTALEDAVRITGVNFYKNKLSWIRETETSVHWEGLVSSVRDHVDDDELGSLMDLNERLCGVHYAKWGFTLALAGVWEVICIDSNVKNHYGIGGRLDLRSKGGIDTYREMIDRVVQDVPADVPPFVAQWVVYDYQRGEHATHDPYFAAAYPFVERA
mgnify:CR=1 FL=1